LVMSVAPVGAAPGNTQVSGQTNFNECSDMDADYAFAIQGDLDGCVYGFITKALFHEGSGTYQEWADEVFIGSWGDLEGTFELTEFYTAKFTESFDLVFARCKHPIKTGTGTGDFEGITGRLDFKDDVSTGIAYYTGHLAINP